MLEHLTGYIFDSFFKIKKIKANKRKKTPESKLVHFFYRIKSGNTTILIMSLEDFWDFKKGTEFSIEVSSNPFTSTLTSDEFVCTGQVKSCREKVGKDNDHYVYSVRATTIQNKSKINEVNMNLELADNSLDLLGSCFIRLRNLHTIREEIIPGANEDPNQKKLDSFMPKDDTKVTISFEENGKETKVDTNLENIKAASQALEKKIEQKLKDKKEDPEEPDHLSKDDQESIDDALEENPKSKKTKKKYQEK